MNNCVPNHLLLIAPVGFCKGKPMANESIPENANWFYALGLAPTGGTAKAHSAKRTARSIFH